MARRTRRSAWRRPAYYPTRQLGHPPASKRSLAQWLAWPSRFWSVGPAISQTLFEGGLRRAQTEQARAAYDATVAAYRRDRAGRVQGVEDNLAALGILAEEARGAGRGRGGGDAAARALTTSQYRPGTVSYLNAIVTQTIELTNRVTQVQILGRRMAAAVMLIQALGGGWSIADLPSTHAVTTAPSPRRAERT